MIERKMTGYPSIDKPWLNYYKVGAEKMATNIPTGKTVWDVIEEKLLRYTDIPAIEYFGRKISRPEFIDMVYSWAKAFKALGVQQDEIIPYYGPFFPDVGAMAFALNIIGACPYFLKLAISAASLAEETKDSRFAIVYSDMWVNVSSEFSKDKFKKIIFVTATDAMPSPKKQIVFLFSKLKHSKASQPIPTGGKYLLLNEAKKLAKSFKGEVKADFVADRAAFITSSSGTTVGGSVKGCVATNESTIGQLLMGDAAEAQYNPGDRCLNHFPPTASTSLNSLFLIPLSRGSTVIMDPRVSENDFYNQITNYHPTLVIHTGSAWEAFFSRLENEMKSGKVFDFSFAKGWIVGGEGTDVKKMQKWKHIMSAAKASDVLASAYGASELFSAAISEQPYARSKFEKQIISVGIPYVGITIGVFDKEGHELGYNQRGELWIKSKTAMKCYYNKPELTAQTKVNGWIHTGDLAEIDESGFVYIWGRIKDTVILSDCSEVYLFDIANTIKDNENVNDAIILSMPTENNRLKLVAHIAWSVPLNEQEKLECFDALNKAVKDSFPEEIRITAYAEHECMLPYSPTTFKKDKNKMFKQKTGYVQVVNNRLQTVYLDSIL